MATLVECVEEHGIVDEATLPRYQSRRQADIHVRTFGVDMLNRSLLADVVPVDFLRGAGLLALSTIGPLRRRVMQAGLRPGLQSRNA